MSRTDPSQIPWWALRFESMVEIDPILVGDPDGPAEAEVDFFMQLCRCRPGEQILDAACGVGVHARLLQERGMVVTGIDLSPRLLRVARDGWSGAAPGPAWMPGDMRWLPRSGPFDAALLLGPSLGFFEDDDEHRRALSSVADVLRPTGKLVCNLYNPCAWAARPVTSHRAVEGDDGQEVMDIVRSWRFDIMKGRLEEKTVVFRDGVKRELPPSSVRAWTPPEIQALFRAAGFRKVSIYGSDGFAVPEEPMPVQAQESLFFWVLAEI